MIRLRAALGFNSAPEAASSRVPGQPQPPHQALQRSPGNPCYSLSPFFKNHPQKWATKNGDGRPPHVGWGDVRSHRAQLSTAAVESPPVIGKWGGRQWGRCHPWPGGICRWLWVGGRSRDMLPRPYRPGGVTEVPAGVSDVYDILKNIRWNGIQLNIWSWQDSKWVQLDFTSKPAQRAFKWFL